jgi:hypothetical protein
LEHRRRGAEASGKVVEAGTHRVALASTRRWAARERRHSFTAAVLRWWHASPAWPCSSRGGGGGELRAKTGNREEGTRGGGRHQEQEKATAILGARLQRASTGGSVHAVKALGRVAGSARAARGVREEEEWRLVARFGRGRRRGREWGSVMTGGRKKGRSSPRASTQRDEGGWRPARRAASSRRATGTARQRMRGGNRGGARVGRPREKGERVGPMKNSDISELFKDFLYLI